MTDNPHDSELARQRILKAMLPSLLVLVLYIFIFARPQSLRINDQSQALARARAADPGLPALARKRDQLDAETKAFQQALEQEKQLRLELQKLTADPDAAADPKALTALEDLLRAQGLHLLRASVDEAATIPQTLRQLLDQQQPASPTTTSPRRQSNLKANGHIWRLELAGTYHQARLALQDLASSPVPAWPIDLALAPVDANSNLRRWTLWVWI